LTVAVPAQAIAQPTNGYIQGDVDLAPGVAIAPGVLLMASPGCRLVISAGVCLGADVVIQARHGDLVIEPGASLGSGVLVVGHGSIGQHTCIGANSTIINPSLGAAQAIAPGSLIGDPTQTAPAQASPSNGATPSANPYSYGTTGSLGTTGHALNGSGSALGTAAQHGSTPGSGLQNGNTQNANIQNSVGQNGSSVYGKTQVNHLLATLFPQRQALNGASLEDRP
jgi:carbon dioxide concentrating mechanism protein CcmN